MIKGLKKKKFIFILVKEILKQKIKRRRFFKINILLKKIVFEKINKFVKEKDIFSTKIYLEREHDTYISCMQY